MPVSQRYSLKYVAAEDCIVVFEGNIAIEEFPKRAYGVAVKYVDRCNVLVETSPGSPYESLGPIQQRVEAPEGAKARKGKGRAKAPGKRAEGTAPQGT